MEFTELKARFDDIAKRVQQSVKNDAASAALIAALIGIVEILFTLFANQSQQLEALTDKLANKTLNSKRANDENINGHRSERNKGIDSSDKGRKDDLPKTKKTRPGKEIKVEYTESYIGYKGKELTSEEAEALIGTVFEGDDGKKYRYTRKLASSVKDELQVNLIETQYYKLEYVEIDEQGQEVDGTRETAVSAKTDFLKKTFVSVNLMAWVFYLWMSLKSPINRISTALSEYGLKLSKQQLYKDIGIVTVMLRPLFEHLESYLKDEKQLCVDETYHSCREKRRRKEEESSLDKQSTGRKEQRAASKTLRSYFYGIVGEKICLYYHDLVRSSDIPKDILKGLGIKSDTFVETDGFYRKSFNQDENKQLFEHGVCWVHAKRYFCVLLNYATTKDGEPIKEFVKANWEQDIVDARRLTDKISGAFKMCNDITVRCQEDSSLDLVALKNRELRPLIEDICQDARDVYAKIKGSDDGLKPIRNCSEKLQAAIGYLVHHEEKLKTFLDSPYGLMHSTKVEEKFRELDILRNSMMLSDTCRGAENLALVYSLYKTAQLNNVEFETYMKKVMTVITEQMGKIKFEKDARGTIINYKSHNIPSEILVSLMPWNMATKEQVG